MHQSSRLKKKIKQQQLLFFILDVWTKIVEEILKKKNK